MNASIPVSLFNESHVLIGFLGREKCGMIFVSTNRITVNQLRTLGQGKSTCLYHMVKNSTATVNGKLVVPNENDEEDDVFSDGQIIRFNPSHPAVYSYNLTSDVEPETQGVSFIYSVQNRRSVKNAEHAKRVALSDSDDDSDVEFEVRSTEYFNKLMTAMVIISFIAGFILYFVLGLCAYYGKSKDLFDKRDNYFFTETLKQY